MDIIQRTKISRTKISPTGDLAFKKVLASEENKDILAGLISDFFDVTVEELVIENPYSIDAYKEFVRDEEVSVLRNTVKDVSASFKTADFASEIQIRQTRFFDERALQYPLQRFCQNYDKVGAMETGVDGKPNRYSSLRPVYALNILGYNHFNDDDALRIFELYDPVRNKSYKKKLLRIGFFELLKGNVETVNQRHWYEYFKTGASHPDAPEYIKKACRVIDFSNLREEERSMALAIEKAQAIYDAEICSAFFDGRDEGMEEGMLRGIEEGMLRGKAEGKAEGITEGLLRGKIETAKNMLRNNVPIDLVAKCTDLSLDYVKSLSIKQS